MEYITFKGSIGNTGLAVDNYGKKLTETSYLCVVSDPEQKLFKLYYFEGTPLDCTECTESLFNQKLKFVKQMLSI